MKLKYHGRNKYPGVGMYRAETGRRWVATGYLCRQKLNLGSFDTPERASLAVRLFHYWRAAGYTDIPVRNVTRDAI